MQIYLVGGAVRDQLLNLPVKDRDWLVVGETPQSLLKQGFQQVGNDFPVFLHPITNEEYALARTERKNGSGYNGFICDFSPDITLEQDLIRRDLTINAIAQDLNGHLYNPFNGIEDLKHKILRHISPAFAEDPLRVLRVARFAARFHHLGFTIAEETVNLMKNLTACGEINYLTAERVWLETCKAFNTPSPHIYFYVLREVGALEILFPEIDQLFGVIQPEKHHPEIDCGIHALMVLEQAKKLSSKAHHSEMMLFGALCHDLGKGTTHKEILPHHYGHEQRGIELAKNLSNRLKVPTQFKDFAKLTAQYHTHCHKIVELKPSTIIKLFNVWDVWRKPQRFFDFLLVCEADSKGRLGFENKSYPQREYAKQLYQIANNVDIQQIIADGFEKQAIREELNKRRQKLIEDYKKSLG